MSAPPFSPEGYAQILGVAKAGGYRMCPFREALDTPARSVDATAAPTLILRHDVDFSIDCAVRMAEFEAAAGVRSTYFVMLACEHYNLLAKPGREKIARIRELGHEIGLHWDSSTYPQDKERVEQIFRRELGVLGDVAGVPIVSAAQHIPTDSPIFNVEAYVENETYATRYRSRFKYVSDSSMRWRDHTVVDLLSTGADVHFCCHPEWWFAEGVTADEKLVSAVEVSNAKQLESVRAFLKYMHAILAERATYDAKFREVKGAM